MREVRYRAPFLERQQLPERIKRERRAMATGVVVLVLGVVAFATAFWWGSL